VIKRSINGLLGTLGYEVRRITPYGWNPGHLRRLGFAPSTLVDVGVARGTPVLYEAFPSAHLVLVEPLTEFEPVLRQLLSRRKGELIQVALGSREERRSIHVESGNVLKSSIQQRSALTETGQISEKREISVSTLDALLESRGWEPPFGLKIDTEGFELEVVKGADAFLAHCQFVIAEVSVAERFRNSYSFAGFVHAMDQRGFRVCDVLEIDRATSPPESKYLDLVFRPTGASDLVTQK